MKYLLSRHLTVAVLAILPLAVLIWASLRFAPNSSAELQGDRNPAFLSQLAALPGSPDTQKPTDQPLPAGSDPRKLNASIPFYPGKLDPAPPFRFRGTPKDLANATQCLALAVIAEAGNSNPAQRAVAVERV